MLGEIFGPDLLIVLILLIVGLGGFIVTVWAIVDAAVKPNTAFNVAGSSKGMWISSIAVFYFFTGIVGMILAIVYLASVRPRVVAAMGPRY